MRRIVMMNGTKVCGKGRGESIDFFFCVKPVWVREREREREERERGREGAN